MAIIIFQIKHEIEIWLPWTNLNRPQSHSKVLIYSEKALTLSGMTCESKKNAHLQSPLGAIFIKLNELGRVSK